VGRTQTGIVHVSGEDGVVLFTGLGNVQVDAKNGLSVGGAIGLQGSLVVLGNTALQSNLVVSGSTTLQGSISVLGNTFLKDATLLWASVEAATYGKLPPTLHQVAAGAANQ
jgi:hypothetical protein